MTGRVSALAVDPRDANTVYLGGAEGGVWKTTDGGADWTPLTDDQPCLSIGTIVLDPTDPDTVYAATGEGGFGTDRYWGCGIMKSTDAGATWATYPGPFAGPFDSSPDAGGAHIPSLAVNPANPQMVLAAVDLLPAANAGIYLSSDGGITWTQVLSGAPGTEVRYDPNTPGLAYAALGNWKGSAANGVYSSSDGGQTWARAGAATFPVKNVGRIRLAVNADSTALYAAVQNVTPSYAALGVWMSADGGSTWNQTSAPDYCRDSCHYHEVLQASPVDPKLVFVAGLEPYRSMDGGQTWTETQILLAPGASSPIAVHADDHALAFSADGSRLYLGCDGGVYSTDPRAAALGWTSLNQTLSLTQFYGPIAVPPDDPAMAFGGTQDTGELKMASGTWTSFACGDGGVPIVDPSQTHTVYWTCASSTDIWKSSNLGVSPARVMKGVTAERGEFLRPLVMDPSNPQRLYYATYRVYQTTDGAATWNPISSDLTIPGRIPGVAALAVAPSDPNTIYAAAGDTSLSLAANAPPGYERVTVTRNALAGAGATWSDRNGGLPPRRPTSIAVDAKNAAIAYLTFDGFSGFRNDSSGHVFQTADYGMTWTDISANLPNVPVYQVLLDPDVPNTLYIATWGGVYQSADGGNSWSALGVSMLGLPVQGLSLDRRSRTLRAATYGRGAWDIVVPIAGSNSTPSRFKMTSR